MAKKICLVDDEEDIREIVKHLLMTKNYEIHTARNGKEGMELIDAVKPDLAVLDLMMPGMSGLEMCKRLRASEEFSNLPILVLSAVARDSDKPEQYWAAGLQSDDFIRKPFEPNDLLARVEYLLRRDDYKKTEPQGDVGGETTQAQSAAVNDSKPAGVSGTPEDVARTFIESWNTRAFDKEYDCLGEEMTYNLSKREYVQRRLSSWDDLNGSVIQQTMKRTLACRERGETATLVTERGEKRGSHEKVTKETYSFKKSPHGWKITRVSRS